MVNQGERIQKTWTELKALQVAKDLNFNYEEVIAGTHYIIYLNDNNLLWICNLTDSGEVTDFETNFKTTSNTKTPVSVQLGDEFHHVDVIPSGGNWRLATDSIVTVEEIFGQDNNADTWFFVTPGDMNDTITITINQTDGSQGDPPYFTTTLTLPSGLNTFGDEVAQYIVEQLNLIPAFHDEWWKAKKLNNIVFIISQKLAERGEVLGYSPDAFTVTTTGTVVVTIPPEAGQIPARSKSTLLTPDPRDNRLGILGVRGEVSTLQRAENPIFANVKENKGAGDFNVVFFRSTEEFWVDYILQFAMGSQLGSVFEVYHLFVVDNSTIETHNPIAGKLSEVQLDSMAVEVPTDVTNQRYIEYIKVNGTPVLWGNGAGNYRIIDDSEEGEDHESKSHILFGSAKLITDTIEIKYSNAQRICNLWCQKENSIVYPLPAPLKVVYGEGLVALYKNNSANAGIITFNLNGYRIDANDVFI